jgi:hypothetical protein
MKKLFLIILLLKLSLAYSQGVQLNDLEFENLLKTIKLCIKHEINIPDNYIDKYKHSYIIQMARSVSNTSYMELVYVPIIERRLLPSDADIVLRDHNIVYFINYSPDGYNLTNNNKYLNDSLNYYIENWLTGSSGASGFDFMDVSTIRFERKLLTKGSGKVICKRIFDISVIPKEDWPINFVKFDIPLKFEDIENYNYSKEENHIKRYLKCHELKIDLSTGEIKDLKRKKLVRKGYLAK